MVYCTSYGPVSALANYGGFMCVYIRSLASPLSCAPQRTPRAKVRILVRIPAPVGYLGIFLSDKLTDGLCIEVAKKFHALRVRVNARNEVPAAAKRVGRPGHLPQSAKWKLSRLLCGNL